MKKFMLLLIALMLLSGCTTHSENSYNATPNSSLTPPPAKNKTVNQTSNETVVTVVVNSTGNSTVQKKEYLCDVSGVPSNLLFQYKFQCACNLRARYGVYMDVVSTCLQNRDNEACACYNIMCKSQSELC